MDTLFEVHVLNEKGMKRAQEIALEFDTLLASLKAKCEFNAGREFALVKTHLEIAAFFAKKAMAIQHENQETKQGDLLSDTK